MRQSGAGGIEPGNRRQRPAQALRGSSPGVERRAVNLPDRLIPDAEQVPHLVWRDTVTEAVPLRDLDQCRRALEAAVDARSRHLLGRRRQASLRELHVHILRVRGRGAHERCRRGSAPSVRGIPRSPPRDPLPFPPWFAYCPPSSPTVGPEEPGHATRAAAPRPPCLTRGNCRRHPARRTRSTTDLAIHNGPASRRRCREDFRCA